MAIQYLKDVEDGSGSRIRLRDEVRIEMLRVFSKCLETASMTVKMVAMEN